MQVVSNRSTESLRRCGQPEGASVATILTIEIIALTAAVAAFTSSDCHIVHHRKKDMKKFIPLAFLAVLLPGFAQAQTSYGRIQTDRISNKLTITITGATPDVSKGNVFRTNNSSPTTITNFLGGVDSQVITVNCGETNTIIQSNASIVTFSGSDVACTLNKAQDFTFDSGQAKWVQKPGGSAGCAVAGNTGDLQAKNSSGCSAPGPSDDGATLKIPHDFQAKGPNPSYDVRAYGARAVSSVPNTTGSIRSGSATLTLAAASTFQNGDGIVVRKAGIARSLATPRAPTVVASNAKILTGTGYTVVNSTGATTYQYCVAARTRDAELTPCSTVTSISNGAATLGAQQVKITSWTRSNNTVTVTLAANHNMVAGTMFSIMGAGVDGSVAGTYQTASATPRTNTFTFTNGHDTRNGAPAAGGAVGTVVFYNCNHITWAHVADAHQYYIYGRTSGSMALLGVSYPDNTSFTGFNLYNQWDDFGTTMTTAPVVPDWVPSTPPVSGQNGDFVTTILSGAGTTTLTLAANAPNTVAGSVVKFDNTPNIVAAFTAAGSPGGPVYFPFSPDKVFQTNSYLTIPGSFAAVIQAATLQLGDTMQLAGNMTWTGIGYTNKPGFSYGAQIQINGTSAFPALYNVGGSLTMRYVNLSTAANGLGYLQDAGGIPTSQFEYVSLVGGGSTDYMGIGMVIRGNAINGGATNMSFKHCLVSPGPGNGTLDATPYVYFATTGGPMTFSNTMLAIRGIFIDSSAPGSNPVFDSTYIQGGVMPTLSFHNAGAAGLGGLQLNARTIVQDTTGWPFLTNFGGTNGSSAVLASSPGSSQGPFISGNPLSVRFDSVGGFQGQSTGDEGILGWNIAGADGIIANSNLASYPSKTFDAGVSTGSGYQFFVNAIAQAAPTCAVSAGGTVGVARYHFKVAPVFPTGANGEGALSPASTACTTTGGNQTITIRWATVPGATGYDLYYTTNGGSFFSFQTFAPWVSGGLSTSYVWSGAATGNQSAGAVPGTGPTSISRLGVVAPQMVVTGNGFKSTITAPTLTANRQVFLPDADAIPLAVGVADVTYATGASVTGFTNTQNTIVSSSNQFVGGSAGVWNSAKYTGNPYGFSAAQGSAMTLGFIGAGNAQVMACVRLQAGIFSGYCAGVNTNGAGTFFLQKFTSGESSTLGSVSAINPTAGDWFYITAVGSTITAVRYVNGVLTNTLSGTDRAYTAGAPGMAVFNNTSRGVNFEAFSLNSYPTLDHANDWTAAQNFPIGLRLGGSTGTLLSSASGNSGRVAQSTGTLGAGKLGTFDAGGNIIQAAGSGTLGITIPRKILIGSAFCNNTASGTSWNLPTASAPTANCNTGSNVREATLDFADGQSAQYGLYLPSDWTGAIDARLLFFDSSSSGTVIWNIQTACTATGGTANDDSAFNAADAFATITLNPTANALWETTKSGINTTGCSAGNKLQIKISRSTDTAAGVARFSALELTTRAAI
jgi:hypothetical protein